MIHTNQISHCYHLLRSTQPPNMKRLALIPPKPPRPNPMLLTICAELVEVLPAVLPRDPLRRVAVGLSADLDKRLAVEFGHVRVRGGHHDVVGAVAEFVDGFVGVRGPGYAARCIFHPVAGCYGAG